MFVLLYYSPSGYNVCLLVLMRLCVHTHTVIMRRLSYYWIVIFMLIDWERCLQRWPITFLLSLSSPLSFFLLSPPPPRWPAAPVVESLFQGVLFVSWTCQQLAVNHQDKPESLQVSFTLPPLHPSLIWYQGLLLVYYYVLINYMHTPTVCSF